MPDPSFALGLSQKSDGQMKLYPADGSLSLRNRKKFFQDKGLDVAQIVSAGLTHGNGIAVVGAEAAGQTIAQIDGLITSFPELILTVTVADCLPIYFFDPKKKVVGLAHAGWKGVRAGLVAAMIEKMASVFDSKPQDIIAAIGPHIKSCHFEILSDVAAQFSDYPNSWRERDGRLFLDLAQVVRQQLAKMDVASENITISDECTYCQSQAYFSFRRDRPTQIEAMIAYIMLKNIK